jgi:hypothetical protein
MAMTKYSEIDIEPINGVRRPRSSRNWLFEIEPYVRQEPASFTEVAENLKAKRFLKQAIQREFAPESLINSIRAGIRE